MKTWQSVVLLVLVCFPLILFAVLGAVALWQTGGFLWSWPALPLCWAIAYFLGKRWRTGWIGLSDDDVKAQPYWTPRDEQALKIVKQHRQEVESISSQQFVDPQFYLQSAQDLALKIARHYHPQAKDPLSSLTLPEVLAAAHLALEGTETWVRRTIPAGHLLTIGQWRTLAHAPRWYRAIRNSAWGVSIVLNPASVGRLLSSRMVSEPLSRKIQDSLMLAVYQRYLQEVGFYLIEMNSGRLRLGADHYRRAVQSHWNEQGQQRREGEATRFNSATSNDKSPAADVGVRIALVGQVKAGKSSLVNALLGEQQATVDVLPQTSAVQRYRLELADSNSRLDLLDTPGYGDSDHYSRSSREFREVIAGSDLILLVVKATSPARKQDVQFLQQLNEYYGEHAQLKPVPVVAVLTHIDRLTPVKEWEPPYNWQSPVHLKEQNIREALDHVAEEFAPQIEGVIPVCCAADGREPFGVDEWLLPAITASLGEAQACSFLRNLHQETDQLEVSEIARQLYRVGKFLLKSLTVTQLGAERSNDGE